MLSVDEARARMLAAVEPLQHETVAIDQAFGRILAEPLFAGRDQPPFAASAMDGYALASVGAQKDLAIVGESAAGRAFTRALGADEAIRISTGAPLPAGADGVLIQEDARVEGDRLIGARVASGRHVRAAGCDFRAGAQLLEAGRMLDPIAVALAASAGAARLNVAQRPRVRIFAGGDEIVAPGAAARADQVFESGSFAVRGLAVAWGADATTGAPLQDDEDAIVAAARSALAESDLVVLIGGASVGPHDHARAALKRLGVDILVDKVAVRPGKPTWFGVAPTGAVLGLPGNPASAIVCAVLFLRPLIARLTGCETTARARRALLSEALGANGPRESYLRAKLGDDGRIAAFGDQDSSLLSVFAEANALLRRAANAPAAEAGEAVEYLALAFD